MYSHEKHNVIYCNVVMIYNMYFCFTQIIDDIIIMGLGWGQIFGALILREAQKCFMKNLFV